MRLANLIDGALHPPASDAYFPSINPATGEACAEVPDSGAEDINRAVEAARCAFPGWSSTSAYERAMLLFRIADLLTANLNELAQLESQDNGKPVSLARRIDIPRAIANFRFFAGAVMHDHTEAHPMDGRALNVTLRQPLGPVALISPWNLPLYLLSWKIAPALATGNTAVAKPSEVTPMTAHRLAVLCVEAGLPPGVLNIVHGRGAAAGAPLVEHEGIKAVSFTGGTVTGATIARAAAPQFKKLSLELGGKNPTIICADADLDEAVPGACRAAFTNQGEICLCGSRIFVHASIYDTFLDRFVTEVDRIRVGDPADPETQFGAVVSRDHHDKVVSYIALAKEEGGTILRGGGRPQGLPDTCTDGFFIEPTVITGLGPTCRVQREEIFGPVVTVSPFDDDDHVIGMANDTPYGLSASVWTTNLNRAHRIAARLDVGTVWVNCWLLRDLRVPFGGTKASGVGREGGREALRFFTEPKNVCIQLEEPNG